MIVKSMHIVYIVCFFKMKEYVLFNRPFTFNIYLATNAIILKILLFFSLGVQPGKTRFWT